MADHIVEKDVSHFEEHVTRLSLLLRQFNEVIVPRESWIRKDTKTFNITSLFNRKTSNFHANNLRGKVLESFENDETSLRFFFSSLLTVLWSEQRLSDSISMHRDFL